MQISRIKDFQNILNASKTMSCFETRRSLLITGDSLEALKNFPDNSVSLILTDPPYHSTKKKNIYGDTKFKEDEHYLEWMLEYTKEWARILKPNGCLFCFCSPTISGRLENVFSDDFNILSHIVWTKPNDPGFDGWKQKMNKESLRQWYCHSERILFAEPARKGNLHRSYFGNFLRECRIKSGLTSKELTELIGAYGRINHGGAVSNWEAGRNIPSKEQYDKIRHTIVKIGKIKSMPNYEDVVRPFIIDKTKEFTDIWNFPNVRPYKGKHPAEKPIDLLEHAIAATTFPDDIVLDCFAGSGSTAVAALKLGRHSISIEIDATWSNKIKQILKCIDESSYKKFPENEVTTISPDPKIETLFSIRAIS